MSSTIIYAFLGVILLLNLLFLLFFMKNKNKKSPATQTASTSNPVHFEEEPDVNEDAKTQALGSSSAPVQPSKVKQEPISFDEKTEVLGISNLTPQEKALLGKAEKHEEVDETVILGAKAKQPIPEKQPVFKSVIYKAKDKEEVHNWNEEEVLVIGRDPQACDLTITTDNYIGRTHALIYLKENKYFLVDLDSKNGTYVENLALKGQKEISLQQSFKLGQTDIVVR